MKICILTTSTTAHRAGGTEVQAETLAAGTARHGDKVLVLTTAHPAGLAMEKKDGYTVIYLPGTDFSMSRAWARRWWRESAAKLQELHKGGELDIVWAENFAGLSYAAIPAAQRAPVISIVNGLAVRGEILSRMNGVSGFKDLLYFFTHYAAQILFYYIPWFRAMVRDSDLLAAVSNETAAALETEFPGSRNKTAVILNPVDTDFFKPDPASRSAARKGLGLGETDRVILMAGVIHTQKGMHLGLKVFAELSPAFKDIRLLIAGDGPQLETLRGIAGHLGVSDKVLFCGRKENREMAHYYNAADIYLNPTLRQEGFGLVTAEAMACGLPCLVSRIGGTGSTIDDGVNGFLVKPGDTAELKIKLERLLNDAQLRRRLSAGAREK
ncbi:MAG: hypothetical protein A2178_00775, partial [Planctomycetes bacterium GWC2_49_10]